MMKSKRWSCVSLAKAAGSKLRSSTGRVDSVRARGVGAATAEAMAPIRRSAVAVAAATGGVALGRDGGGHVNAPFGRNIVA